MNLASIIEGEDLNEVEDAQCNEYELSRARHHRRRINKLTEEEQVEKLRVQNTSTAVFLLNVVGSFFCAML